VVVVIVVVVLVVVLLRTTPWRQRGPAGRAARWAARTQSRSLMVIKAMQHEGRVCGLVVLWGYAVWRSFGLGRGGAYL
jgi:hypothetical protein